MSTITEQLSDVFPDAVQDLPLTTTRPMRARRTPSRAARAAGPAVAIIAVVLTAASLADPLLPGRTPELLGQLAIGAWLAASVITVTVRHATPRAVHHPRVSWRRYASERGLRVATLPMDEALATTVVGRGRRRTFEALRRTDTLHGQLYVGATAWLEGGRARDLVPHGAFFAVVTLPDDVVDQFGASSFTRPRAGDAIELDLVDGTDLLVDTGPVGRAGRVRVHGAEHRDARWRRLFPPTLFEELATTLDVEWQQVGRHLVVAAGARRRSGAPAEVLDTLCVGALHLAAHYVDAARTEAAVRAA